MTPHDFPSARTDRIKAHRRANAPSRIGSAFAWFTAVLVCIGFALFASKAFPNTATTSLTAQEQAQAHREGW